MSSVLRNLPLTSGVFLVVFLLSAVSAQKNLEFPRQSDLESMEEIQEMLRKVQLIFAMKIANKVRQETIPEKDVAADPNLQCKCSGLSCSCCHYISVWAFGLYGDCCVNVAGHLHNLSVHLTLTFGSHQLYSQEVSANHLPPICHRFPFKQNGVEGCVKFYDLGVTSRSFKGCIRVLVRVFGATVAQVDLGCFEIHYRNRHIMSMPYLEGGEGPMEGPEPLYHGEDGENQA